MSHIPQRKEKDCLNCGTVVQGPYCHVCGQENVIPKETFWHMVTHFFNDITHFDGSFFTSAKDLLFKPGFLSKEYMAGKRVKYLHPVRMYVFTSAIFFLLFFSFFSGSNVINFTTSVEMSGSQRLEIISSLEKKFKDDTTRMELLAKIQPYKDTFRMIPKEELIYFAGDFTMIDLSGKGKEYYSVNEYDSIQKDLAPGERDSWLLSKLIRKETAINNKYSVNPAEASRKMGNAFLHKLPYLLFISLPLFAFILKLVYIRRKQFYFADHAIFTIHFYIFSFLLLLLLFTIDKLKDVTHWGFLSFIVGGLILTLGFYLYKALRYFYGQRRFKTFIKFLILLFFSFFMMLILLVFFLLFTAFTL